MGGEGWRGQCMRGQRYGVGNEAGGLDLMIAKIENRFQTIIKILRLKSLSVPLDSQTIHYDLSTIKKSLI